MSDFLYQSIYLALHCRIYVKSNNSDQPGLVEAILDSIKAVHPDFYGPLMENILITGGSAQFRGFQERTQSDIRVNCDSYIEPSVKVIENVDCVYSALKSITSSQFFENLAMSKSLYNEMGCSRLSALI